MACRQVPSDLRGRAVKRVGAWAERVRVFRHALGEPAIDLYRQLAQNEQDVFKVEQETDAQLIGLFAQEVSGRYRRGLLRVLWPW